MKKVFKLLVCTAVLVVAFGLFYNFFAASKDHTHDAAEFYATLADGKYDKTFLLSELNGSDQQEVTQYTRTVVAQFFTADGDEVGINSGMGILCGDYMITRTSLLNPLAAGVADPSVITSFSVQLLPNPGLEDAWKRETLKVLYPDLEYDFMLLQRPAELSLPRPAVGCGVTIGSFDELSPGDVLFQVGNFPSGEMNVDQGVVSIVDGEKDIFYFQGTVEFTETGGPVFALRDGKPELVGMVAGTYPRYGIETKAVAVSFNTILDITRAATDIDLTASSGGPE